MTQFVDIVFDGPPGPEAGRFVEVENDKGQGINFGDWRQRDDGYWVLRVYRGHIHVAGTTVGKHIDECARCGRDLRHPIHSESHRVLTA